MNNSQKWIIELEGPPKALEQAEHELLKFISEGERGGVKGSLKRIEETDSLDDLGGFE